MISRGLLSKRTELPSQQSVVVFLSLQSHTNSTLGALFKGIPPFVVLALCIGLFRRLVTKSFSSVAQTLKCKPGNKSKNKIENPKDTALCTSLFLGGGRLKVKLIHAIDLIAASLLTQWETQIEQRPARMSAVVATRRFRDQL